MSMVHPAVMPPSKNGSQMRLQRRNTTRAVTLARIKKGVRGWLNTEKEKTSIRLTSNAALCRGCDGVCSPSGAVSHAKKREAARRKRPRRIVFSFFKRIFTLGDALNHLTR